MLEAALAAEEQAEVDASMTALYAAMSGPPPPLTPIPGTPMVVDDADVDVDVGDADIDVDDVDAAAGFDVEATIGALIKDGFPTFDDLSF